MCYVCVFVGKFGCLFNNYDETTMWLYSTYRQYWCGRTPKTKIIIMWVTSMFKVYILSHCEFKMLSHWCSKTSKQRFTNCVDRCKYTLLLFWKENLTSSNYIFGMATIKRNNPNSFLKLMLTYICFIVITLCY